MSNPPSADSPAPASAEFARYRTGDLLIEVGRQRVTRGEDPIALPKLSYELLLALMRGAPNLLSSDALMKEVWPKVIVSPETLNQRVKLLRDALGDDPRKPRYIEGLRGRGYRWVPAVEIQSASLSPASAGVATSRAGPVAAGPEALKVPQVPSARRTPPPARASRKLWLAALVIAAIAAAAILVSLLREPSAGPPTSVRVAAVQPRAVAVLPFEDLSPRQSDSYIARGVAGAVLHKLAGVPELIVVSRSSSFSLGSPTPDPADAGRRLGVRYIVTGSVQRAGNVLRVTAQLVDARGDREIWSLKLDRPVNAVFALQDQIAEQVARELDVTLHGRSSEYAQYGTEAYLAYLRGRALIDSRTIPDVEASIREFTRATELAPSFAAAIADLARAKLLLLQLRGVGPAQARGEWQEIDRAVERAITIDPQAGEAYFVRGQYRDNVLHDTAAAEADYRAGLELAPNYGPGWRLYATYLYDADRIDEALAAVDRARLVDPLGPENHYLKGEIVRTALGGSEESVGLYLQAIAVAPDFYPAYARLGQVRAAEGRLAQAIQYAERSVAIEPHVDW
ncbi:MAG TPA: winged helix-turn-helix domain-containing protein, partial [Steroidobacteraceae bacterium]|nr:winged helix-turn-helix domain-containing protein [Steroidobacteraceae bacterium]